MKVDFMILGAQKCGTTTLFSALDTHPDLVGSSPKEPHFFCTTENWREELDEYHKHFARKEGALYFEASTSYTFLPIRKPAIWDDLFSYNPNLKFIYVVRNPLDRIISSYMHSFQIGTTDYPIEEAVVKQRSFVDVTRYATQIRPYIETFGRDRVLLLDFDDLTGERQQITLTAISDFLNIDGKLFQSSERVHEHKSIGGRPRIHYKFRNPGLVLRAIKKYAPPLWRKITDNSDRVFHQKPSLSVDQKRMLLRMLDLEIEEVERLMGKSLTKWREI
ncbi:MAG: sulfotransferase [Pirellulaceae bacterium]